MPKQTRQTEFEQLLTPLVPAAYRMAVNMVGHRDDAEDLVQEAAVQAYRAFHTFTPGTNFKAWYFKILTNLVYRRTRKRQHEPEMAAIEDVLELYLYTQTADAGLHARSADPATLVLGKLDEEQVATALASLPEEFRLVSTLYFVEQFSYEEIAEIAGCPVGTVRSRLHRGRKLLQKALWEVAEEHGVVADLKEAG